jgi:hypothetical protein
LWDIFEYLRDNDHETQSGTSRLLRRVDVYYLRTRLSEELRELSGVLDGTHKHSEAIKDLILEGSQALYWIYLVSITTGIRLEHLEVCKYMGPSTTNTESRGVLLERLHISAESVVCGTQEELLPKLQSILSIVAACFTLYNLQPIEMIRHDLSESARRPYIAGHLRSEAERLTRELGNC